MMKKWLLDALAALLLLAVALYFIPRGEEAGVPLDYAPGYEEHTEERFQEALTANDEIYPKDYARQMRDLPDTELEQGQTLRYRTVKKPTCTIAADENRYVQKTELTLEVAYRWDEKADRPVEVLGAVISGVQVGDLTTTGAQLGGVRTERTDSGFELTVLGALTYEEKDSKATVSGNVSGITKRKGGDIIGTNALTFQVYLANNLVE